MKTSNKIILSTLAVTQALAFVQVNKMKNNMKEAEKLEPIKTYIKTIDVDHNGERISISIILMS